MNSMGDFPKAVSVVMRSFNEAWAIGGTIRALFDQDFDGEIELIVIDSGSSDGSVEIVKKDGRAKLIQIPLGTYVPGVVMNRGAREANHDWIIYLNADATPADRSWLKELISPCLVAEKFGAGFSRQIPRPDCQAVYAHDYDRCFGPQRESASWSHFFSMVSSVTHRSVLEAQPFREDLQYAEDDEWTLRLRDCGYSIVYAEKSVAVHSHNYTMKQSYKRGYGDAKAKAIAGKFNPIRKIDYYFIICGAISDLKRDFRWCAANGRLTGFPRAVVIRVAQRIGRHLGYRDGSFLWQAREQTTSPGE
jgi:rhamnosyltransferase